MVREKDNTLNKKQDESPAMHELILFNDDVHSFDFVIEALIDICHHEHIQAEQCAFIAHFKGRCPVKSGHFDELKPKFDEMSRRGLTVTIESI